MFIWLYEFKYYDVSVMCDGCYLGFMRVYDNKIVFKDIFNYNIVEVFVCVMICFIYVESRMIFYCKCVMFLCYFFWF